VQPVQDGDYAGDEQPDADYTGINQKVVQCYAVKQQQLFCGCVFWIVRDRSARIQGLQTMPAEGQPDRDGQPIHCADFFESVLGRSGLGKDVAGVQGMEGWLRFSEISLENVAETNSAQPTNILYRPPDPPAKCSVPVSASFARMQAVPDRSDGPIQQFHQLRVHDI
jgi:hypothetical protein